MKLELIMTSTRSVVVKLSGTGKYYTKQKYKIYINADKFILSDTVVTTIYGLKPNTKYHLYAKYNNENTEKLTFTTEWEYVTLNVKDFGAVGDGLHDDTNAIQAAIMACPANSRVLFTEGIYKVSNIFLKSDINITLNEGAILSAYTDRTKLSILPGVIENYDENDEYNIGSYGGNPLDTFAGIITGIYVKNVTINGKGIIDGCAGFDNWWKNPKKKDIAWRPRLIFLNHCENIVLNGITVINSPHWTIHPYFCKNIKCIDVKIKNPQNSHNTDGFNPESCENVMILGTLISVGDDCIAIKSGKIYMAKKNLTPTIKVIVQNCCMKDGHGAVTIGSENAAGIFDIKVKDCEFINTDRGLRIKTRRGRGEKSVIDNIIFDNIYMNGVMTPIVINSFYFCDPDGKTQYVASKEALPIDERTPYIKKLSFCNIYAVNCHVAAVYIYGLPERKIERIHMENVDISFAKNAKKGMAAMMFGCKETSKSGITIVNVEELWIQNVSVHKNTGETFIIKNVDRLIK